MDAAEGPLRPNFAFGKADFDIETKFNASSGTGRVTFQGKNYTIEHRKDGKLLGFKNEEQFKLVARKMLKLMASTGVVDSQGSSVQSIELNLDTGQVQGRLDNPAQAKGFLAKLFHKDALTVDYNLALGEGLAASSMNSKHFSEELKAEEDNLREQLELAEGRLESLKAKESQWRNEEESKGVEELEKFVAERKNGGLKEEIQQKQSELLLARTTKRTQVIARILNGDYDKSAGAKKDDKSIDLSSDNVALADPNQAGNGRGGLDESVPVNEALPPHSKGEEASLDSSRRVKDLIHFFESKGEGKEEAEKFLKGLEEKGLATETFFEDFKEVAGINLASDDKIGAEFRKLGLDYDKDNRLSYERLLDHFRKEGK